MHRGFRSFSFKCQKWRRK